VLEPETTASDAVLELARQALERGDYGRCQQCLAPLLELHPVTTKWGAQIRLLLATAQMGQGDCAAAAATCRSLRACRDLELRSQAKALQDVLEAPELSRPREWSMTLPNLAEMQPLEGQYKAMARSRRRRQAPPPPPAPPTGPTKAPLGFAVVALVVLLITALLGGCVDLETSLRFPAPGRLQITQTSVSSTGRSLPWQRQLAVALRDQPLRQQMDLGTLQLSAPVMSAQQALALLSGTVERATELAALDVPPPQLSFTERNWLLGVRQQFSCSLDLSGMQPLPGLQLTVNLDPLPLRAVRKAQPHAAEPLPPPRQGVRWPLQPGAINQLQFSCWRWSRLGLGALVIGVLLVVVAVLQRLKLAAGFGPPQLPA
jgi:hypothetical protein